MMKAARLLLAGVSVVALALFVKIANKISSAVFNVEIEQYWNERVEPFLVSHAGSWVATMFDFVSGFWGGVVVAMAAILVADIAVNSIQKRYARIKRWRWVSLESMADLGSKMLSLESELSEKVHNPVGVKTWGALPYQEQSLYRQAARMGLPVPQERASASTRLTYLRAIGVCLSDKQIEDAKSEAKKLLDDSRSAVPAP